MMGHTTTTAASRPKTAKIPRTPVMAVLMAAAIGGLASGDAPAYPDQDPRNRGQSRPAGLRWPKPTAPMEPNPERQSAAEEKRARRAAQRLGRTP